MTDDASNKNVPIYRPISHMGLVISGSILILAAIFGWMEWQFIGAAIGVVLVVGFANFSRRLFAASHIRGLALVQSGQFEEAIAAYDKSLRFFEAYPWLDKFRFITMLSSASMSYREMALVSQAYCHVQLDNIAKARSLYQQSLDENPANALAAAALKKLG